LYFDQPQDSLKISHYRLVRKSSSSKKYIEKALHINMRSDPETSGRFTISNFDIMKNLEGTSVALEILVRYGSVFLVFLPVAVAIYL